MRPLNNADDRWLCLDSPDNPLQIGGLLLFDRGTTGPGAFAEAMAAHLRQRLGPVGVAVAYSPAPFHFDFGAWLRLPDDAVTDQIEIHGDPEPIDRHRLHEFVTSAMTRQVPTDAPPFRCVIFDEVMPDAIDRTQIAPGRVAAIFLQIHHALADGIGFQAIVELITDGAEVDPLGVPDTSTTAPERPPPTPLWLLRSSARFVAAAASHALSTPDRRRARTDIAELRRSGRHVRTPSVDELERPGPAEIGYDRCTLELDRLKSAGSTLGGTVNDALLTVVSGALERFMSGRVDPAEIAASPLVAVIPRSLRQPDDHFLGNHLTLMIPQLATNIADPRERFAAIHDSVRLEIARSDCYRRLQPLEDRPFAARRRRQEPEPNSSAGNVSISNVPGPSNPTSVAGYEMLGNYPTPSLIAGKFLNITSRRYERHLQLGISKDKRIVTDDISVPDLLQAALEELVEVAA